MNKSEVPPDYSELVKSLKRIDERLSRLEEKMYLDKIPDEEIYEDGETKETYSDEELEFRIGESWLPKVGILTFITGMVFFLTLPLKDLPAIVPLLVGYILAFGLIVSAKFFDKSESHISGYLLGGGGVVAYLTTLRLHFFSQQPLVESRVLLIIFLFALCASLLFLFIKRRSVYLTALCLLLCYATAVLMEVPLLTFIMLSVISAITVSLTLKIFPRGLLIFGIVLTYTIHLHWFINSPFLGNQLQIVDAYNYNLIFILLYSAIFSIGSLRRENTSTEDYDVILGSFLNSIGTYTLLLVITLLSNFQQLGFYHLLAFAVFLTIAIAFWKTEQSRFSTFLYAMAGYAALSAAIFILFDKPANFVLLSIQSLIVISTALWFRSKFIILANLVIFFMILIAYIVTEGTLGFEGLTFGITALISARVLNWKKDRLEIQTEYMRNAYLLIALLSIPYVFYSQLPVTLVGLAILALSLFYFAMSKLLNNLKYRWMAMLTLLLTVFYLVIFGVTSSDSTYKIISFLSAGVVLIITSFVYGRMKPKSKTTAENKNIDNN